MHSCSKRNVMRFCLTYLGVQLIFGRTSLKEDCAQDKYKAHVLLKDLGRVCHCNSFLQTQKILKELVGMTKGIPLI